MLRQTFRQSFEDYITGGPAQIRTPESYLAEPLQPSHRMQTVEGMPPVQQVLKKKNLAMRGSTGEPTISATKMLRR